MQMTKDKKYKSSYYTKGATAYKVATLPDKKELGRRDKRNDRSVFREVPKKQNQNDRSFIKSFATFSLYLFLISIIVVILKAGFAVNAADMRLKALNNELTAVKDRNEVLLNKIKVKTDAINIRDIAINELGMVNPMRDDVMEIDISSSPYTVVYSDMDSVEDGESKIVSLFKFVVKDW